ncbi:MAG TPA: TonB-dependent receptor [Thermoanaerobaculia bacterium]|nr:TonB-dependent receptor [Thermoanaerobaculia bacterium]
MRRLSLAILFLALAFTASSGLAQTTGDITGHITDEQGGVLPGVTVEARGPAFQGTRTNVTDANGVYRLVLLPPGTYKVTASLQGFAKIESTIIVSLGKTSSGDFKLRPTATAEVVVSGNAPLIDQESATIGNNIDSRQIKSLPTGRDYSSVVQISAGVSQQTSNTAAFANTIVINGSTGLENGFVIDGVNTTGVEYGQQGKDLNYEFIQEVEVKTGGYQAEFGGSTGGIVNVITKSGGNEYHGEGFVYYSNNNVQAANKHPEDSELFSFISGYNRLDYGFDLGGFALKDRLWFFGAYDRVQNTTKQTLTSGPNVGQPANTDSHTTLGSAKLTWMLNASNSLVASYFQDPQGSTGAVNDGAHPVNGPYTSFIGLQTLGGSDYSLRYNGIFGSNWVVSAQGALHQEQNSVDPGLPGGDTIQYVNTMTNLQEGGFGLIQEKNFKRWLGDISVTKYLGPNEIKAGFGYQSDQADVIKRMSGGQQVTIYENPNDPNQPVYSHFYWTIPTASLPDNVPTSQLNASPYHHTYSFYLQDTITALPNLTFNVGIRYDNQQVFSSDGTRQIDLTGSWAPRIGFTWDPTKDSKTKVFGSFGYFYEQIPMDLVIRSYSSERQPVIYNFDPTSIVPDVNAATIIGDTSAISQGGGKILGGFNDITDANLKGQYLREGIIGVEREIVPSVAVGARYIYRDLPRVVEDFLCDTEGDYCVGNPTVGTMANLISLDYGSQFPAPKAQRIYRGFQFDATKRFSDNWTVLASYVYSTLKGNYDGLFAPYTQPRGSADPNISALYDYYDFFTAGRVINGVAQPVTSSGYLSNDRRSVAKLSGVYVTPFNLSVGLVTYYQTGTPISAIGFSDAYTRPEFFLTPRGSVGRVPDSYDADLHLGYPLQLGPATLTFLVDVFNILNTQRIIAVDQRYNLAEFYDPNTNTTNPTYVCGSNSNPIYESKCNPTYGQPIARTLPTSVRFGLKVGF